MCGIFGIIRFSGLVAEDSLRLRRLADALVHRGPDGEGLHVDGPVGLGMRRLAIIDLEGGWQPLFNEDRSAALVANGEVYNFVELRRELERSGHAFATRSDCETILHLYEDRAADCIHALRGMFAFALHDRKRHRVLIGRDRMGEKPLYIVEREGFLAFASELGALVRAGIVPFEPDPEAIELYYHYGFVPEPRAAIRGVAKLPAGHLLDIDLGSGRISRRRYWSMEDVPERTGDPATAIRETLEEIGELIIRSDVPVGVALSGGLDSSAIATLAARRHAREIQAFTIGYPGRTWQDERAMAAELASHLRMPLHTIEVTTDRVVAEFPAVCFRRDDPISDISGSSYFAVMRLARDHGVPVMLMGHGGDELFWGYGWVRDAVHENELRRARRAGTARLSQYLTLRRPPFSYTAGLRWLRAGGGLIDGLERWRRDAEAPADEIVFYDRAPHFREAELLLPRIAGDALPVSKDGALPRSLFRGPTLGARPDLSIVRLLCGSYLLGNGIAQGDRLSMANSVECRLPFVDYRLVETVTGLRRASPDAGQPPKAWLRAALRDIVPEFVFARRKRGFTPPWRQWTRAVFDRYGGDLADGTLVRRGLLHRTAARGLARGIGFGSRPLPLAWSSMVLEQWCRGMEAAAADAERELGHVASAASAAAPAAPSLRAPRTR